MTAEPLDALAAALRDLNELTTELVELTTRVLDGLTELLFKASAVWN